MKLLTKRVISGLALGISLVACNPASAQSPCSADAQAFWKGFRAAVMKRDMKTIMKFTQLPFTVSGSLDTSAKTILANSRQFSSAFPAMLNSDPGLTAKPTTMAAVVRSLSNLGAKECASGPDQLRVGDWTFRRTGSDWRFVNSVVAD